MHLLFNYITFPLALAAFILSIRIVWRVEKRLNLFFKLFTAAVGLFALSQLATIFVDIELLPKADYGSVLDLVSILVIIFALMVMNSLVTSLDGEK